MTDDPYLWLEEVDGAAALDWVRTQNASTEADLFAEPLFEQLRAQVLALGEAEDRLVVPSKNGDEVTNFWTDATHRRGVLRRTSWEDFLTGKPSWETLLDIDALGAAEGESWVLKGLSRRVSDRRRMLVELSPGGGDATTTREFDLVDQRFVPAEEGGFVRPLSKGSLDWIDDDTVFATGDFGPGTMTTSGYARTVRRWSRGTALEDAPVVFEVEESDVWASASVADSHGARHELLHRGIDFYTGTTHVIRDGEPVLIDVPLDAMPFLIGPWLLVQLRTDWEVHDDIHPAGSVVVTELDAWLEGRGTLTQVFVPDARTSLVDVSYTSDHLLVTAQRDVRSLLLSCRLGDWDLSPLADAPQTWTLGAGGMNPRETDELLLTGDDFLTPPTLTYVEKLGAPALAIGQAPQRFDTSGMGLEQLFVESADGTQVPYFVVGRRSDEPAAVWMGGYGGFQVSRLPSYSGMIGQTWLDHGGVHVLVNARGGGEYGPAWHQAALREKRPRVYEDFEAVARDLVARGITTASQLGISGGSNGGLLVGNLMVRHPELYGAVVCQVPLLDMKRYSKLLAGASWMAEYGNPDVPEDWDFIKTFSPYHLAESGRDYPPLLLTTSTRDDRVHPGHARKFMARLTELGYDVSYWENMEGGHGGAADAPQAAVMWGLTLTFLHRHLRPTG
jgi:prolyl oligopeptidase